jgi:hypothetical protein
VGIFTSIGQKYMESLPPIKIGSIFLGRQWRSSHRLSNHWINQPWINDLDQPGLVNKNIHSVRALEAMAQSKCCGFIYPWK